MLVTNPTNPLQKYHIIVAQLPALPANGSSEYGSRFHGHWQFRVILMHDQLLDAGKWWSLEPEITLSGGLDNEVLMAIPTDTEHNLALLVSNRFADQEVTIVIQQSNHFLARQNAMEPFLLVKRTICGERYLKDTDN